MFVELAEMEGDFDAVKNIYSMLDFIYRNALNEAVNFRWASVPKFDKAHYKNVYRMIYNGACPVENIPIKDNVIKNELWEFARCYTISDTNNRLAYTFLVGQNRFPKALISDKTKNALGLHVGNLNGVKLQENFLSKALGHLLYDIVFSNSPTNFGKIPMIVRDRLVNDTRNTINRNGEAYELHDKDGAIILSVKPAKTFFTRRDTVQIKCSNAMQNVLDDLSVEERKRILAEMIKRYNAKNR